MIIIPLFFSAAVSEVFWSASILAALGSTLQVILHIDVNTSIIISAVIAVCYTLFGGLISVAYTDVFQLFFIAFGLVCICTTNTIILENISKTISYTLKFRCKKLISGLFFTSRKNSQIKF